MSSATFFTGIIKTENIMEKKKEITGAALKWIAIITMLIDHIGAAYFEPYIFGEFGPAPDRIMGLSACLSYSSSLQFLFFMKIKALIKNDIANYLHQGSEKVCFATGVILSDFRDSF